MRGKVEREGADLSVKRWREENMKDVAPTSLSPPASPLNQTPPADKQRKQFITAEMTGDKGEERNE